MFEKILIIDNSSDCQKVKELLLDAGIKPIVFFTGTDKSFSPLLIVPPSQVYVGLSFIQNFINEHQLAEVRERFLSGIAP